MKQQQTGHVLLMSRATLTIDFLNQQAMLTAMKSCALFLIPNQGTDENSVKYTCGCQKNAQTNTKHRDDREDNKTPFGTTQKATNFSKVQTELVPVITATKIVLRNP